MDGQTRTMSDAEILNTIGNKIKGMKALEETLRANGMQDQAVSIQCSIDHLKTAMIEIFSKIVNDEDDEGLEVPVFTSYMVA